MKFLLKVINAERAAMCAPVYRSKLRRTRRQMLENIVESYKEGEGGEGGGGKKKK